MVKKTLIVFTILIKFIGICYAQIEENDSIVRTGLFVVEKMPIFDGELNDFIKDNINYPRSALLDSIEGTVFIYCRVDTLGKTIKHEIYKGIREDINQEAIRVARLVSFKKPAMNKNRPVVINYIIPIIFNFPSGEKQ